MTDFSIHSRRVFSGGSLQDLTAFIQNGKISDVVAGLQPKAGVEMLEAGDLVVMPGLVDPHVHINEPGRTDWEGFETATRAAISGGLTTLIDMPLNASPVTTTAAAFDLKLAATTGKLYTNVGFWGGLVPGNSDDIGALTDKGVLGFKAFLTHSGIDEFPNVTEADLYKAMPAIAASGLPLLVHCELTNTIPAPVMTDPKSYQQYLASRPKAWENEAVSMMIRLCEQYNCRVHIVHLSSAEALGQIKAAKATGLPLTVETGQHYLYFNAEEIPDGNTAYKCAPPIRETQNNDLLWEALEDGIIDFVATDHSPAPPDIKLLDTGDLSKAWGGIASIQFALPVLWTAAKKRNTGPEKMGEWLSEKPASLAGLADTKGKIAVGYDADLLIWDPEASFTVMEDMIRHKHKATPYLGENLFGIVRQTFLAGQLVYNDGLLAEPGRGSVILGNS